MKILVPLDGSTTAEAAVPLALQLARAENAGVVLLMVTNVHPAPDPAPCDPDVSPVRDAHAYLETARRHLASGYPDVSIVVWRGAPAAAIVAAAQEHRADRIVMTTHGRSGLERDVFGSVADAVLRNAPMSVIVVRPRREAIRPVAGCHEPAAAKTR
jgi:nucleotide-binding universal stress UspA family protein